MKILTCIALITVISRPHQARLSVTNSCRAPEFYTRENNSLCAVADPCTVFRAYGYNEPEDNVPDDLLTYNPPMLHEDAIVREIGKDKQFRRIGNGSYATAYLAILRHTRSLVVLKTFIPDFQIHENIDKEYRVHKYLENTGHVPKIFGILYSRSKVKEMSLVIEYLQNSISLDKLINSDGQNKIPECLWFYICVAITKILQSFHRKYVTYSDLHENNIMIQWRESEVKVYIIDFGEAWFRCGTHYDYTDVTNYPHLAPEMTYEVSTPTNDVYSLGKVLQTIASHINNTLYYDVADQCRHKDPELRPKLDDVIMKLQTIGSKCSKISHFPPIDQTLIDIESDVFRNLKLQSLFPVL